MHFYAAGKEEYIDLAGPASNGVVTVFAGKGMLSDYPVEYKKRWGIDPELVSSMHYDAMKMTVEAFERAQSTDSEKFAEAFGQTNYVGICGRWVFGKDDHEVLTGPDNFPYLFNQIWDGKRNVVWPFNFSGVKEYRTPPWLTQ
jgi:ABC-type branched-subunit amino acid transport system substrate-binding protein